MIKWYGKSTNGNWKRREEAESFLELYNICVENDTINTEDSDPWDDLILEKSGKLINDFEDESGFTDCEKLRTFIESDEAYSPTDKDIWQLIKSQKGNAYYQTFECENLEGNLIEIDNSCFDKSGNFIFDPDYKKFLICVTSAEYDPEYISFAGSDSTELTTNEYEALIFPSHYLAQKFIDGNNLKNDYEFINVVEIL